MVKTEKGKFGSLKNKKKNNLIFTIIAFSVVIAVFVAGLLIFHNKNNYMTIISIVLVLPAAKIAVGYFVLLSHKPCERELYERLEKTAPSLNKMYDLIISNTKKPVGVQACVITEKCICAYTLEEKTEQKFFEKSVTDFIKNEKLNVTVTLYKDEESFLRRVSTLETNFNSEQKENMDRMKWNSEALLHMCI